MALYVGWQDIKKRISEAQEASKKAIIRIGRSLFHHDLRDAIGFVLEIREACRQRNWTKAIVYCEQAKQRIARLQEDRAVSAEDKRKLAAAVDDLGTLVVHLEKKKSGADLTDGKKKQIDDLNSFLSTIEGRMRAAEWEMNDG